MANPVDRSEINQMAKFLSALGNDPGALTANTTGRKVMPESNNIAPPAPMVSAQSVSEMSKFMKALGGNPDTLTTGKAPLPTPVSEDSPLFELHNLNTGDYHYEVPRVDDQSFMAKLHTAATNVIAEAPRDSSLREALGLERTKTGIRYGSWEIVEKQGGKRKTYDVVHTENAEVIASELVLYEAACGLVRALNEGKYINSKDVVELLGAEHAYMSAVNDIVLYKHYLKKNPNSPRATLYETRIDEAKDKAVRARSKVTVLSESF